MSLSFFNASSLEGIAGLFVGSLGLSLLMTRYMEHLGHRISLLSAPHEGRWHQRSTPTLGGVGIYTAFLVSLVLGASSLRRPWFLTLLAGGTMVFALGLIDDLRRLRPQTKLIGQIIAACMAVLFGVVFAPETQRFITIPLTIFWIVGITNAFNLLDNMDGLSAGVATIACAVLFVHALLNGLLGVAAVAAILAGATLGFLRYNFHPARIFMGDSGSLLLGYLIAVMGVLGTGIHASNVIITLIIPILVLAVPIFDTTLVTLLRMLRRQPASQGGKDHSSHRLVYLGLSERRAVFVLYGISAFLGMCALFYSRYAAGVVSVIVLLALIGIIFFGFFLSQVKVEEISGRSAPPPSPNAVAITTAFLYKRRILEVLVDLILICVSYYGAWLIRFEGVISEWNYLLILRSLPWIVVLKLVSCFSFGVYGGVWRYYGLTDLKNIVKAVTLGSVLSVIIITLLFRFIDYSRAVFVTDWMMSLLLMAGIRILLRMLRESFSRVPPKKGKRVIIMGAGDAGEMLLRELRNNRSLNYHPVGFIDDDREKLGRSIHGLPILGTRASVSHLIEEMGIAEVLIAIPSARDEDLAEVYRMCANAGVPYKRMAKLLP